MLFALAIERGVGDLLEQSVDLAVQDAMALQDGRTADRLCEVALARARVTPDTMLTDRLAGRSTTSGTRYTGGRSKLYASERVRSSIS
jgi:hypothetical protein